MRKRLLKEKVKEYKCESCKGAKWMGEPIPLELHHKDGCNNNHKLYNLMILCCNCHAQTPTYCGKNKVKKVMT